MLRETTSRGLCGLVCPSRTSEPVQRPPRAQDTKTAWSPRRPRGEPGGSEQLPRRDSEQLPHGDSEQVPRHPGLWGKLGKLQKAVRDAEVVNKALRRMPGC